jgi:hypothetical protein
VPTQGFTCLVGANDNVAVAAEGLRNTRLNHVQREEAFSTRIAVSILPPSVVELRVHCVTEELPMSSILLF